MKMQRSFSLGVPVALLLAAGSLSFRTQDPGEAPALAGTVGVVDALAVFNAYPRAVEGMAALEALNRQDQEDARKLQDQIDQQILDAESRPPGSEARAEGNMELQLLRVRLQALVDFHKGRMASRSQSFLAEMYDQIWKAVEKVAVEKGLLLVLRVRDEPSNQRTVLYALPKLDLTEDVIRTLKVGQ